MSAAPQRGTPTPELWTRCPKAQLVYSPDVYHCDCHDWGTLVRVPFDAAKKRGAAELSRVMGVPSEKAEMYDNLIGMVLLAALGGDI